MQTTHLTQVITQQVPQQLQQPPHPPSRSGNTFIAERLVRFSDCDPAGIVFFPNYFILLNGVVEDWWQHIGKPWTDIIGQRRMGTPIAQIDTTFVAPSFFGETLHFCLSVQRVGRTSLVLAHRVLGPNGDLRVQFTQRMVVTSLNTNRPIAWPTDVEQAILAFKDTPDNSDT